MLPPKLLDGVPLPGLLRVELGIGVLPPPDPVVLEVAREDDVEVAVAVDVERIGPGLDVQWPGLDDVPGPAGGAPAVPDQGRRLRPFGDGEIVDAVLVDIADEARRLLFARIRDRQIAVGARQVPPFDVATLGGTAQQA